MEQQSNSAIAECSNGEMALDRALEIVLEMARRQLSRDLMDPLISPRTCDERDAAIDVVETSYRLTRHSGSKGLAS